MWSDHGTYFFGAAKEIQRLVGLVKDSEQHIRNLCTTQGIQWKFTPVHAPHFGGLWEAVVKSIKNHFRSIVGDVKLTFEKPTATALAQIEACLNSRPLTEIPEAEDGIEALTPGHFLIGCSVEALPVTPSSFQSMTMLRRWEPLPGPCAQVLH